MACWIDARFIDSRWIDTCAPDDAIEFADDSLVLQSEVDECALVLSAQESGNLVLESAISGTLYLPEGQ